MEHYDDRFHKRKHPRMRHYDYTQPGYYFVTICTKEKNVFIVLSGSATDLSVAIGQYKSAVTRNIRKIKSNAEVWQTSFHDHVIRSEEDYRRIWAYIDTNPIRWKDDCFYAELFP